jgi:hypothetical protein
VEFQEWVELEWFLTRPDRGTHLQKMNRSLRSFFSI